MQVGNSPEFEVLTGLGNTDLDILPACESLNRAKKDAT